jgi:hypothetical protein
LTGISPVHATIHLLPAGDPLGHRETLALPRLI